MVTKRTVTIRQGSEGPKEDPYHFDEVIVTTDNKTLVWHFGLGVWLKINGQSVSGSLDDLRDRFRQETGAFPEEFQRWKEKRIDWSVWDCCPA